MAGSNVELVRTVYESFAARQFQQVIQLASPDLQIEQSPEISWGGRYSGVEGMRQFMVRLAQHVDSVMTPDYFVDAGEHVVAIGRTRGTARATGRVFDVPAVHVWTVSGGKFTRFQAFIDHPAMRLALPTSESSR